MMRQVIFRESFSAKRRNSTDWRGVSEAEGGRVSTYCVHHRDRRNFAAAAPPRVYSQRPDSLFCDPIHRYGTDEQKKKFLLPFTRGEKIGCYALTDSGRFECRGAANESGEKGRHLRPQRHQGLDHQRGVADAAIVYTNTDPAKGEKGITAIVVEKGAPGFKVGKEEKNSHQRHACSELVFTDCVVPLQPYRQRGRGYKVALSTLDGGRIGIACRRSASRRARSRRH